MGTNGCPQEALAARQRQSRQAMPAAPGMPGQPRQILAMAVKAQVTAAPVSCPLPVAREGGAGRSSGAGPGIASRPDPVAGINRDTVRAPAADAGRRQARAARHLAGVPGRRLMPAAQPASLRARRQATMTSMRPPRTRAAAADSPRRPPGNSQREAPWPPGTGGHARAGPVSGKDCRRPGSTTGTDPGRGWTAPSPVPKTAHGKPADRAGKTGRSLASPPLQSPPGALSCR